ncbi:hypothetical protein IEQ34_002412 [Dendrobium chrysotoxum]|uniref:Chromo domain-containing protein n=1 Tax=Dendrobium chrysotoxum TaxID=161865 RepID=A0AAV7HM05_DENCH|nr:hypothetical protein IEQ34_002412 [Dendrobium chrysotoxum]
MAERTTEEPWKILEFYSGIGGMRYSLMRAEIHANIVEAFDINDRANDVYMNNFGRRPFQGNIQSLSAAELDKYAAHAWLLSPPCQPYTRQGLHKDSADARASSFIWILELIPQMRQPPIMLFVENVVGFEISNTHKHMMDIFAKNTFVTQEYILSPLQFRIPYSRPRYFCLVDALEECLEGEMSQIKATVEDKISSVEDKVSSVEDKVFDLYEMVKKILKNQIQTAASDAKGLAGRTTNSEFHRRDNEVEIMEERGGRYGERRGYGGHESRGASWERKEGDYGRRGADFEGRRGECKEGFGAVISGPSISFNFPVFTFSRKATEVRFSTSKQFGTVPGITVAEVAEAAVARGATMTFLGKFWHSAVKKIVLVQSRGVWLVLWGVTLEPLELQAMRKGGGVKEVLIKWNDLSDYEATWEPYERAKRKPISFKNPSLNYQLCHTLTPLVPLEDKTLMDVCLPEKVKEESYLSCLSISNFLETSGSLMGFEQDCHGKEADGSVDILEKFAVPHSLIERWGRAVDIVYPSSKRCCCFTKSYFRYVKGTGSLLATSENFNDEAAKSTGTCFMKDLGLRYFTPREVANLHSFPLDFCFPEHITIRQQYALLGNSLSIAVVAPLLQYLFAEPT